ncbi:MAG: thioredoxin domain-containing protein [Dehalococcoidia bacterium]|nr:thioredoxin domain-containing protein [Dehalococcoidia bacterium]
MMEDGEAEVPPQGEAEVPPQGEAELPVQGAAEVPPPGVTEEAGAPAEGVGPAGERRGGLGRYGPTAAISGVVVVLAVALFTAGFWAHSLLDDDVDLAPIKDELVALNKQADEIQVSLRGDGGGDGGGGGAAASPEAAVSAASEDDPTWGPEDASVVIVEFSDFQCPFCERFATETLPRIQETYGDRVKFIYRDFPLSEIHPFAQKAAEAAQCAQEQGYFWDYHDLLFENQGALDVPDLKGYAEQVGADVDEFNGCLDSGKHQQEVLQDIQDGRTAGITGTPGFLINNSLVSGAQPYEQFQQVLDQLLAAGE